MIIAIALYCHYILIKQCEYSNFPIFGPNICKSNSYLNSYLNSDTLDNLGQLLTLCFFNQLKSKLGDICIFFRKV